MRAFHPDVKTLHFIYLRLILSGYGTMHCQSTSDFKHTGLTRVVITDPEALVPLERWMKSQIGSCVCSVKRGPSGGVQCCRRAGGPRPICRFVVKYVSGGDNSDTCTRDRKCSHHIRKPLPNSHELASLPAFPGRSSKSDEPSLINGLQIWLYSVPGFR